MQVVVNNLLTHYQLQGTGKLVLFLHGWGDNSQGSTALQAQLAKSFTVLAPDLPGFGKTQAPSEGWNLDNYAEFVKAMLAKLEVGQPYAVIGHSNGGAIAVRATALGELQPQKLVLLASAGIRNGKTIKKGFMQVLAKTGNVATLGMPERYRQTLRRQLYKSAGSDMMVVPGMQDTFKKTIKQDVQAEAAEITLPTLLIFGDQDKAVPPSMGQRYHSLIKNSQLHVLKGSGHFVHLDKPEEVTKLTEEFLK